MAVVPSSPNDAEKPSLEDPQRQRIIDAATEVFRANGLAGARTREIAASAAVKETTLFRYFKSKEDIFFASVLEPVERMVAEILVETSLVNDLDEKTRNRTFISEMERHLQLVVDLTPLLSVALVSDPQLGRTFYNERLWPLIQRWVGAADSSLRNMGLREVDALTIILTTWGMSYGIAINAALRGDEIDVKATARWLSELVYSGIAPTSSTQSPRRGRLNAASQGAQPGRSTSRQRSASPTPRSRRSPRDS